jgi:hypothetical protein
MRLFSEKVNPTFNSSGYNILTVKDYTEVFFDVYEFEINGSRFVAEKTGVFEDSPIVSIPVDHNNIVEQYDFVLHKGSQSIHFDPSTTSTPSHLKSTSDVEPLLVESVEDETDEVFLEDRKVAILEEIEKAKVAAAKYISQIEKQNKRELVNYQTEREVALKEDIDKQKRILLDEFYTLVEGLRVKIAEESNDATLELKDLISDQLKKVSSNVDAQIASAEQAIDTKIEERANELLNNVLLSEVKRSSKDIADNLNSQVKTIAENISKSLTSTKKQIEVDITEKLQEISTELNAKDKAIVELNDTVNKQSNRALSRIGTVKTQLEGTVKDVVDSLEARIDSASDKLTKYYSEKLQLVEASLSNASEHTKNHIIGLIKESYQSLQDDIANIKVTVPNIVIEKSNGKQEIDVTALRTELEKSVSGRFVNEIASLKRLIELSSGGGSVAMQFAAGGTMNGNLNVTGQYLSAGVDLLTIFSGGGGDDTYVNTLVRSNSANWDGAYNTSVIYQSNSATYATIDFTNSKFFTLSGGTVTGPTTFNNNVTIQGNLTALGTTTFNNTIFSVTSALSVVHVGGGPAMWVGNNGTGDIASFYDIDQNIEVLHVGGVNSTFPNVGVHTSTPNERFTVSGNISASGSVFGNNLVYTAGDQTIAGAKTFSNNIVGNGTANRLPNQLAVASSDIITKGLADSRYTSRNERITDDTTFLQTTWEQFLDFDDQYNADLTLAAASGGTTFGASPAVFGDVWTTSNAGVTAFSGNDAHTHRGIFLVRGPTASSQAFYIGINRTTIPYNLTNRIDEFTCRVFVGSTDFRTQGYFKIGIIPKGGTGGADQSLRGGLIFNPYLNSTNLVLGVNKAATASPYTFTTTSANVDFLDTGVNFIDLLDKWVNITYRIDRSVGPTITIIITRENVILFQASYNTATDPVVSTWTRKADLYLLGASNEIGIQNGKFTYTTRSQLHIDYLYYKVTGTSAAPSNWNSLRF